MATRHGWETEKTAQIKEGVELPRFPHLVFYEAKKYICNSVAFTDEICSNQ
jgi:hypothetical protein